MYIIILINILYKKKNIKKKKNYQQDFNLLVVHSYIKLLPFCN